MWLGKMHMKIGAKTHPKLYELCERLDCSRPTAIGYLELLWAGASEFALAGNIGKFSDGVIARWCDWDGDSSVFVRAMVESGWIDEDAEHRLIVHDWQQHCPNWVRSKLKRSGQDFATATSDPTYTPTSDPTYVATDEPTCTPTDDATCEATIHVTSRHVTSRHATPRESQAESNRWEMLLTGGAAAGLEFPRKRLEACRERGVSPDEIAAVLDYWREHSSEFDGPGALIAKLDGMFVDQAVEAGWPKRTARRTNGVDVGAERAAVLALGDAELEELAEQAFKGQAGLQACWKSQGRQSGVCIDHIARFRIRSRK